MTNIKTTIVLAILAGSLGVMCIIAEATRVTYTPEGNIELFSFKIDDAVRLKVAWPQKNQPTVEAVRTAEGWQLTAPIKVDADKSTVERIVGYMGLMAATAEFDEDDSHHVEDARTRIEIEVELRSGDVHKAWIGRVDGSGFRVFARASSRRGIFIVSKAIDDAADRDLVEFRDKRLFTVDYFDIEEFRLENRNRTYHILKRGETWTMRSPFVDMADEISFFDFLSNLDKLKVREFAAENPSPSDLSKFGLHDPVATVMLRGKGRTSTVSVGRVGEGDQAAWYARRHDRPWVARVDGTTAKRMIVDDPYAFRGRSLTPLPSVYQPSEIEVKGAIDGRDVSFMAKKSAFRWVLTQPRERDLDPSGKELWGQFVESLASLNVEEFVAEDADEKTLSGKYGLGDEALRIRIRFDPAAQEDIGAVDPVVMKLRLGKTVTAQGICYAMVEGQRNVVAILDTLKRDLRKGYVRFLNRDLVPIREEYLVWVEFEHKGKKVRWEKKGQRWLVTEPEGAGVAPSTLMRAAMGASLTKAEAYVQEVADPAALPKAFGLNPPVSILRVAQYENNRPGARIIKTEMHIGNFKTNVNLYARYRQGDFQQGDLVFLIGRAPYDVLVELWSDALGK